MKPHKHAELIKAWADGAEIERCWIGSLGPWTLHDGAWDVAENYDFRIKQEPKPDVVKYFMHEFNSVVGSRFIQVFYEGVDRFDLAVTWDGETGKIKKAEVL